MKKVSRIMLLVSGIMAFVAAGALFIGAAIILGVMFVTAGYVGEEGGEAVLLAYYLSMSFAAALLLIIMALSIVSGIVSFKARKSESKSLYIVCIVFGALSDNAFAIAGAVLGLIAKARNQ